VIRHLTAFALAALGATGAAAQTPWTNEIGIQGGYSRVKPAGTSLDDQSDLLGFPGFGLSPLTPSYGALYAIVPLAHRLALEPSLSASQISFGLGVSTFTIGLRLDYALSSGLYAAAGGTLGYAAVPGGHETQLGLQVGTGYRLALSSALNGRVEVNWITTAKTDDLDPANVYSVILGVSSRLSGPARARPRGAAPRRSGRWRPALGIAGGYAGVHIVDQGDVAALAFPGFGAGLVTTGLPAPMPPTLFVIIPIARNLALEPGFDLHRIQDVGAGETSYSANYAARLNYAFGAGWYAAAGANLWHFVETGNPAVTVLGAGVAWGYQFRMTGALGGRVEINYTMFPHNDQLGQASNTLGLMLGATMPLR